MGSRVKLHGTSSRLSNHTLASPEIWGDHRGVVLISTLMVYAMLYKRAICLRGFQVESSVNLLSLSDRIDTSPSPTPT